MGKKQKYHITEIQKQVIELRAQGLGYKRIASQVEGVTRDNVRDFINSKRFKELYPDLVDINLGEGKCKVCKVQFKKQSYNQIYCSEECRRTQANNRQKKIYKNTRVLKVNICKHCGIEFDTYHRARKYCSDECKRDYYKEQREYKREAQLSNCVVCGSELPKHRVKFCSNTCFEVHRDKWTEEREKNPKYKKQCKECGKGFGTNQHSQMYCSRECVAESQRKYPASICEHCGDSFRTIPGRANRFCTRECFIEHTGAEPWEYKKDFKNITHIRRAQEYDVDYELIDIERVFEECGWVCQICGEPVDRYLAYPDPLSASVDHIKPMSKGGAHIEDNIQLAHLYCNISKSDSYDPENIKEII